MTVLTVGFVRDDIYVLWEAQMRVDLNTQILDDFAWADVSIR